MQSPSARRGGGFGLVEIRHLSIGTPFRFCFIPEQTQPLLDNIFCVALFGQNIGTRGDGGLPAGILPNCFFVKKWWALFLVAQTGTSKGG